MSALEAQTPEYHLMVYDRLEPHCEEARTYREIKFVGRKGTYGGKIKYRIVTGIPYNGH